MEEKSNEIPSVVASEGGKAQTSASQEAGGLRDPHTDALVVSGSFRNAARYRVKVPYAKTNRLSAGIPSKAEHVKLRLNPGGPPSKAKYSSVTDSEPVP